MRHPVKTKLLIAALAAFFLVPAAYIVFGIGGRTAPPLTDDGSKVKHPACVTADGRECDGRGLTLTAENVTPSGCTLRFAKGAGAWQGEACTGTWFRLDVPQNKLWAPLPTPDGTAWNAIAVLLPAEGEETAADIGWTGLYGELPAGRYRIVKEVVDVTAPGEFETLYYCAYFEID